MTTDNAARQATFNSEYGSMLVGEQWRQHFISDNPRSFRVGEHEVLQIEAFELLHVRPTANSAFRALLTIHTLIITPDDQLLSQALREHQYVSHLLQFTRKMLEDSGAFTPGTVLFPGREPSPTAPDAILPFAPPPFAAIWLPPHIVQSAGSTSSGTTAEQNRTASRLALAELGWRWSRLPGSDGVRFEGERVEEANAQLHVFSHSWAVSMSEYAVVYLPREEEGFVHQAIAHAFATHLDVCLLVLRTRLLQQDLSTRVAEIAQSISQLLTHTRSEANSPAKHDLVEKAIRLDAEAAAFVASTWGADVSPRHHLDVLLTRLQELGNLNRSISLLVEQTRWLRESVQTLIEREEHQLDQERAEVERQHQESARTMEWALGFLAFIGLPLGIAAELYAADKWTLHPGALLLEFFGILVPIVVGFCLMVVGLRRWYCTHQGKETLGKKMKRFIGPCQKNEHS